MKRKNVRGGWIGILAVLCLSVSSALWAEAAQSVGAIPGETADSQQVYWNVGPGLALFNGNTGWAVNAGGIGSPWGNNVFVGADLGMNFYSYNTSISNAAQVSSGADSIQLLPTILYRVDIGTSPTWYPYLGLSAGPNLYVEKVSVRQTNGAVVHDTNTSLFGEILIRPGLYYGLTDSIALNGEAKLGWLHSDFIFLPQVNAVFTL